MAAFKWALTTDIVFKKTGIHVFEIVKSAHE